MGLSLPAISQIQESTVPSTDADVGENEHSAYIKRLERDALEEKVKTLKQDREERLKYANKVYFQTALWLWAVLLLVLLCGFGRVYGFFYLSDPVILGVIGGTTTTIIGLFIIVVKYLFPNTPSK